MSVRLQSLERKLEESRAAAAAAAAAVPPAAVSTPAQGPASAAIAPSLANGVSPTTSTANDPLVSASAAALGCYLASQPHGAPMSELTAYLAKLAGPQAGLTGVARQRSPAIASQALSSTTGKAPAAWSSSREARCFDSSFMIPSPCFLSCNDARPCL